MRVRQSEDRRKINCSDDQGSVEISQLEERRGDECESDGDEIDEDEDGWLRRGEGRKTEEDSQGIARCQKKSRGEMDEQERVTTLLLRTDRMASREYISRGRRWDAWRVEGQEERGRERDESTAPIVREEERMRECVEIKETRNKRSGEEEKKEISESGRPWWLLLLLLCGNWERLASPREEHWRAKQESNEEKEVQWESQVERHLMVLFISYGFMMSERWWEETETEIDRHRERERDR
jgi:hypothetical protein